MKKCKYEGCGRKTWKKSVWCIFHEPDKDKDADLFWKGIDGMMEKEDYIFRGFYFIQRMDEDIIRFLKTEFKKEVIFTDVVFAGNVLFEDCKFCRKAIFDKTKFNEKVWFSYIEFINNVYFSLAKFKDWAKFDNVKFFSDAEFSNATFDSEVSFIKVTFEKLAIFEGIRFNKEIYVYFYSVTFDSVTFVGDVLFKGTQFINDVNFTDIKFVEQVYFDDTTFSGDAEFNDVTFSGDVSFDRAIFSESVSFKEMRFVGNVSFCDTRFPGSNGRINRKFRIVYFCNVLFIKPVIAKFYHLDLSKAIFLNVIGLEKINLVDCKFSNSGEMKSLLDEIIVQKTKWRREESWERDELRKYKENLISKIFSEIAVMYRQLKINYEKKRNYPDAGDFYIGEMEMRRENPKTSKFEKVLLLLYKLISYYGESYKRALCWIVGLILLSAFILTCTGVTVEGRLIDYYNSLPPNPDYGKDYLMVATIILRAMTLQPLTSFAQPAGLASWIVLTFTTIFGILLIALFTLALRRRFRR